MVERIILTDPILTPVKKRKIIDATPGPRGPKGDRGRSTRGPKGDRGRSTRGPKGDQGEKGDKGDRGEKGNKGDQGRRGLRGWAGDPGRSGFVVMGGGGRSGGSQGGQGQTTVVDGIQSNPPKGGSRIVNIFVNSDGKLEIEHEV